MREVQEDGGVQGPRDEARQGAARAARAGLDGPLANAKRKETSPNRLAREGAFQNLAKLA